MFHVKHSIIYQNTFMDYKKMRYCDYHWHDRKIKYRVYGSGRPILLIHDLSVCSSPYEWNAIIEKLGGK